MAISSSVGRRFTVGEIVTMAFRLSGQVELSAQPSTAQMAAGRNLLEVIIDKLEQFNVSARATKFELVTLSAGINYYDLPDYIVDVLEPAKYIAAGEDTSAPSSEISVAVVSREQWHGISSRAEENTPSMVYAHKELDQIRLYVWPTPDEAGTLRLLAGRRLADVDVDGATLDLETYWNQYLIYRLAELIADSSSLSREKVRDLRMIAELELKLCRARSTQQMDAQIVVDHGYN